MFLRTYHKKDKVTYNFVLGSGVLSFIRSKIYISTYCVPGPYVAMNTKTKICDLMELTFSWAETDRL